MSEPDLESLRLFVLVASTGGVARAAREAGVSQQAVSARMASLERELGVPLLIRTSHGSRSTEQGALVAEWAASLLEAADRFGTIVAALRETTDSSLRLAASLTIAEHLAPAWLVALRAAEPAVRIELVAENSAAVFASIRDRRADLGFVETPDVPDDLPHRLIAVDELVVVVRDGHPWTRRRDGVTPEELAATPIVSRESGSGTRLALEQALIADGHRPVPPALELSTTSAIRSTVAAGDAPAVLSILAVREQLSLGTLRQVRLRGMRITRPLNAVWSPGTTLRPAAARLLSLASEQ